MASLKKCRQRRPLFTKTPETAMMAAMKRHKHSHKTIQFIVISVALMMVVHFVADGALVTHEPPQRNAHAFGTPRYEMSEWGAAALTPAAGQDERADVIPDFVASNLKKIAPPQNYPPAPAEKDEIVEVEVKPTIAVPPVAKVKADPKKSARDYAPLIVSGSPQIAIIIDDMGVDRKHSRQVIDMDAALTLAFLPYAEGLAAITKQARDHGHELMIHMPMQATTNPVSLGPIAIKEGMSAGDVRENMEKAFESFSGYEGLNNHMGSLATQDPELMDAVMESIKKRGIYFVDSKTINSSIAADVARSYGIPTAERDVFLDHETTKESAMQALRQAEDVARRKGYAITIGHPKSATIAALREWLPDAQARGFKIVPASALVKYPKGGVRVAAVKEPQAEIETPEIKKHEPQIDTRAEDARAAILRRMLGQAE
ncbi:MAG: divergent polysaccharide deacetylase family protein [Magnetococcus sp. WYHC-3]